MHIPGVKRDVRKQQHIQSCVSNKLHLMMRALKKKKKRRKQMTRFKLFSLLKRIPDYSRFISDCVYFYITVQHTQSRQERACTRLAQDPRLGVMWQLGCLPDWRPADGDTPPQRWPTSGSSRSPRRTPHPRTCVAMSWPESSEL